MGDQFQDPLRYPNPWMFKSSTVQYLYSSYASSCTCSVVSKWLTPVTLQYLETNRKHTCSVQTRSFCRAWRSRTCSYQGQFHKKGSQECMVQAWHWPIRCFQLLIFLNVVSSGSEQLSMVPSAFNVIFYEPTTYPKSVKTQNEQANGTHTQIEQPFKILWVRASWGI